MQDTPLDLIILHYILRNRKFMMELSRSVRSAYFHPNYQTFFSILYGAFLNPRIKEVLSLTGFIDYCGDKVSKEQKQHYEGIYNTALALEIDGRRLADSDFTYFLQKFKERYNAVVAENTAVELKTALTEHKSIADINEILREANREVQAINKGKVFDEGSLGEDIINIFNEYEEVSRNPQQYMGISSGFPSLDAITKGYHGGELIIIAGFEGSGKSLLCMQMAVNAWMGSNTINTTPANFAADGHNIVYFSLEMPRSNRGEISVGAYLNKRMVSCVSGVDFGKLRDGSLEEDEFEELRKACRFIKKYDSDQKRLYVVDIPRGATVDDIEAKFLEISEKFPVDMVIIDYIGLMKGAEDEADWQAQGQIAAGLHEMARVYNVPVISPVQVNRPQGANHSLNKQSYNTTRLARASGIGQNANLVLQIGCRDNEHLYQDMPIYIIKARDGAKGELTFQKNFGCMQVHDGLASDEMSAELTDFIDLGEDNE